MAEVPLLILPIKKQQEPLSPDMTLLYTVITVFNPFPHTDASVADDFWKHCGQRINCLKRAISTFATTFSTIFSNYTLINGYFSPFSQYVFKVVCCILDVCGNGLTETTHPKIYSKRAYIKTDLHNHLSLLIKYTNLKWGQYFKLFNLN